jgi:hypothetical protein
MTTNSYTVKRSPEHVLQATCIQWFRANYPTMAPLLFAVPNGAKRTRTEAAIKKSEGMSAGVSDLILLVNNGIYGSLCIEMKAGSSQSREQKRFQAYADAAGQKYVIVRSLQEFADTVDTYLSRYTQAMEERGKEGGKKFLDSQINLNRVHAHYIEEDERQRKLEYEKARREYKKRMEQLQQQAM